MHTVVAFDASRDFIAPLDGTLREHGFVLHLSKSMSEIPDLAASEAADLTVLCVNGYDKCALDVLRLVEACLQIPVVVASKRDDDFEGIVYLEVGADDYVTRPIHPRVLIARLHASVRRNRHSPVGVAPDRQVTSSTATFLGWHFDPNHRTLVSPGGSRIALSEIQSVLLEGLLRRPGTILSRSELIRQLGKHPALTMDDAIIAHISRLRGKFEPEIDGAHLIKSRQLTGYVFNESVRWD
jgi:DNA-binding response OmpR family regulator